MKTNFAKTENHLPQYFLVDAKNKTLGRLAVKISKLLRGKEISFNSPGVDQGNYVAVINTQYIKVTGNKEKAKLYYQSSQRPGGLKSETLSDLRRRLPARILERAIWGMLPKGVLGRQYYKRLFVYSGSEIKKTKIQDNIQWKNIDF